MTVKRAFSKAFSVYRKSPADTLKWALVEICFLLAVLTPLLFLWGGKMKILAAAVIPLFVLLLPARMNSAAAMKDALEGGNLCSYRLIETAGYGRKLLCALKRAFFILLWGAPLIACCLYGWEKYAGETDAFTLLNEIRAFGGGGKDGIVYGVIYIALVFVAVVLILLIGLGFHSGARHAFAAGDPARIRGRHGKNLGCWLCANVVFLPLLISVVIAALRYAPLLQDINRTINGILRGAIDLPDTRTTLLIIAAGAVLTLPLLPLRSLITAAYVNGPEKE